MTRTVKPVRLEIKGVPTLVEVIVRQHPRKTKRVVPMAWRKLTKLIGEQLKAGGAVDMVCREVCQPVYRTTRAGLKLPVHGRFIIEVADVRLEP